MPMKKITILGVPMWLGQDHYGVQLGPDAIRATGLIERLNSQGRDVTDLGNLAFRIKEMRERKNELRSGVNNLIDIRECLEVVTENISRIIGAGNMPLILGGDHSLSVGSLAGIAQHYQNLGVIWYDAHADSNTPETSMTGNAQGMPLAVALGYGDEMLVSLGKNKVSAENVVMIGTRDIDPGERAFIISQKIKIFTSEDVQRRGIHNVVDETISYLTKKCDGVHLSYDLDVLDPWEGIGVGTPVANGLSLGNDILAMKLLAQTNMITSVEFVELNPLFDKDKRTAGAARVLIENLLYPYQNCCFAVR